MPWVLNCGAGPADPVGMKVPSPSHITWSELITGRRDAALEFLAGKLQLGAARARYADDPLLLPRLAEDLRATYARNVHLPSVQRDLLRLELK